MSAIPVGNQLYIYALLSREVGVGRQTMLARVEETLLAHDIWPSDLGCADTRELMDKLDGFIRVAVFKKGRVYVTVLQQPEWDAALEQIHKEAQSDTPKKKSETNTPKAWKRKRGKKELKPVKPRPKGRPKPEPEEEKPEKTAPEHDTQTSAAEASAAGREAISKEPATVEGSRERLHEESGAGSNKAPGAGFAEAPAGVPTGGSDDTPAEAQVKVVAEAPAEAQGKAPAEAPTEAQGKAAADAPAEAQADAPTGAQAKAAAVTPAEARDKAPVDAPIGSQADAQAEVRAKAAVYASTGKPTKAPAEVLLGMRAERPVNAPSEAPRAAADATAEASAETQTESSTKLAPEIPAEIPTAAAPEVPTGEVAGAPAEASVGLVVGKPNEVPVEMPAEETLAVAGESEPSPKAPQVSQPTLDVKKRGSEDSATSAQNALNPKPKPAPDHISAPVVPPQPVAPPRPRYPRDFLREVLLPNEPLSALYQVLPLDVDPMMLLEEDWRISRSTKTFRKEGPLVIFPLRYVRASTQRPVEVSMRRISPTTSGKEWRVEAITGEQDVSFDGLPVEGTAAFRELAQFAELGSWQSLVRNLKRTCGKGGLPFTADELRTYLPYTFHRILLEDKFVTYTKDDGPHPEVTATRSSEANKRPASGAFNTGLLSDDYQTILMCFEAQEGDIPWRFTSFQKAPYAKLTDSEPAPATYVRSLADIAIFAETPVQPSKELADAYGPEAWEAIRASLRRAQRDYRLATPAYDPVANVLRILLPLCLEDAHKPSHALVLCPVEDGEGFVAKSVLPLARAAVCARVVSFELPQWLLG